MNNNEIGKKIKQLRKSRGLNQQVIADAFSVTRGTVSNWEIGRRIPDVKTLEKLASYYDVSMEFFVPTTTKNEVNELLARATEIFKSDAISEKEKNELHNQLIRIYINAQYE